MKKYVSIVDFNAIKYILFFIPVIFFFTHCKKDAANLTDPAAGTPAISFTFNNIQYEYISNRIKDADGKVLDAFGYRVVANLPSNNYKTYLEVNGTSNNESIKFTATYNSILPLPGDSVAYSLKIGNVSYYLPTVVTDKTGNNYVTFFNGKTANFYQGKFAGDFLFFSAAGPPQKITVNDGTFLVTQAKDQ